MRVLNLGKVSTISKTELLVYSHMLKYYWVTAASVLRGPSSGLTLITPRAQLESLL